MKKSKAGKGKWKNHGAVERNAILDRVVGKSSLKRQNLNRVLKKEPVVQLSKVRVFQSKWRAKARAYWKHSRASQVRLGRDEVWPGATSCRSCRPYCGLGFYSEWNGTLFKDFVWQCDMWLIYISKGWLWLLGGEEAVRR